MLVVGNFPTRDLTKIAIYSQSSDLQRVPFGTPVDFKGRGRAPGGNNAQGGRGDRSYRHHKPTQTVLRI
jgi:hypothetical protein